MRIRNLDTKISFTENVFLIYAWEFFGYSCGKFLKSFINLRMHESLCSIESAADTNSSKQEKKIPILIIECCENFAIKFSIQKVS